MYLSARKQLRVKIIKKPSLNEFHITVRHFFI